MARVGDVFFVRYRDKHRHIFLGKSDEGLCYFALITSNNENENYYPYIKLEKSKYPKEMLKKDSYVGCATAAIVEYSGRIDKDKTLGTIDDDDMNKILDFIKEKKPAVYKVSSPQFQNQEDIEI